MAQYEYGVKNKSLEDEVSEATIEVTIFRASAALAATGEDKSAATAPHLSPRGRGSVAGGPFRGASPPLR